MYPESFDRLIIELHKLPGIGLKSAERIAFQYMDWDGDKQQDLIDALKSVKDVRHCRICGNLSDDDLCSICSSPNRDHNQICVVSSPKDLFAIENIQSYNGTYHVLNGMINPQKGILPEQLNIDQLEKRINENTKEVILALDPTMEGETTSLYLTRLLENQVPITRLAYGIPVGGKLDYADARTLEKAFEGRQSLSKNGKMS